MTLEQVLTQLLIQISTLIGFYITSRKAAAKDRQEIKDHNEASVKEANGSFGYAVANMDIPMYIKLYSPDAEGRPRFLVSQVNQLYADFYGLNAEDKKKKTEIAAGVPKVNADYNYSKDVEVWSTKKPVLYVKNLPGGRQVKFRKIPFVNDEGKVIGVQGYEVGSHCRNLLNQEIS